MLPTRCSVAGRHLYAEWLEFVQVAKELGDKVRLVKVDTDENPELSSQLQVLLPNTWVPMLHLYRSEAQCLSKMSVSCIRWRNCVCHADSRPSDDGLCGCGQG